MVNCNPETVSTDYDTSDRLYFEPLGVEEVLAICEREQPVGVVIQFGGQTPLKLARAIEEAGFRILGTPFDAVDLAEDRERFGALCRDLGIEVPAWGMASTQAEAIGVAERIGYPVLVRPSYVLGGRQMVVCYDAETVAASVPPRSRVLVDRFLEGALELDVDALCDGTRHLRRRGDAARRGSRRPLGRLELRPAASRPGRAHACGDRGDRDHAGARARRGRPRQRAARRPRRARVRHRGESPRLTDRSLREQGDRREPRRGRLPAGSGRSTVRPGPRPGSRPRHRSVSKLPFSRSSASPAPIRCSGPRCGRPARSWPAPPTTQQPSRRPSAPRAGRFRPAARRSCRSATGTRTPSSRSPAALADLGFSLAATSGTARVLAAAGLVVDHVRKVTEPGEGATVVDLLRRGRCDLVVNTPQGSGARTDGYRIRDAALVARIPCITTVSGAAAAVHAIAHARGEAVVSLQERIDAQARPA